MSNQDERVVELTKRVENFGLRLEFDCDLLLVKRTEAADPTRRRP
jgi:hypothetical protein